jgi:hypothetical protein
MIILLFSGTVTTEKQYTTCKKPRNSDFVRSEVLTAVKMLMLDSGLKSHWPHEQIFRYLLTWQSLGKH